MSHDMFSLDKDSERPTIIDVPKSREKPDGWCDGYSDAAELLDLIARGTPKWMRKAACKGMGDLFFPTRGDDLGPAKRVCAACPVQKMCLEYALKEDPGPGVWGGLGHRERIKLRRARNKKAS